MFRFLESQDGHVYAATGRGVDRITPGAAGLSVRPVDLGFDTGEVRDLAHGRGGVVWIAAATGLFRLGTLSSAAARAPRVFLQRLTVRGREWPLPGRGTPSLGPLTLPAGDDDVRLEFVAPLLTGRAVYFQYRFNPQAEWTPPSADHALTFARLTPGTYALQVRAVIADQASDPAILRFRLLAPMWERWWFRAAAGLAVAWHRTRIRGALALERVRAQIAADLHDDVGSRLAEIAIVSELGVREARDGARDRFTHVAATARDVRQAISDVVWAIDPRCDHLSDLATRIRVAAEALLDPAIEVTVSAPAPALMERVSLSPDHRRQLLLIAREALVNIQKHAAAARVQITITLESNSMQVTVEDDGRGIVAASPSPGLGLVSMRSRAEALGGTLTLSSPAARGTRVTVDVPFHWRKRFFVSVAWACDGSRHTLPSGMSAPTRVAIVEDQRPLRAALGALIEGTPGFQMCGSYGSAEALLDGLSGSIPDVLLLDIGLPGRTGLEVLPTIRELAPACASIMLTIHVDEERIFQALTAGAVGYLVKDTPPARLLASIQEAATGGAPMTPEIARKVVALLSKAPLRGPDAGRLSERETEVLQHLADGYSYQNIAARLEVSVETVRTYIRRIYDKLHVHTKSEAVAKAIRAGFVR